MMKFVIFLKLLFSILLQIEVSATEPLSFIEFRKIYKEVQSVDQKEVESYLRSFIECCRPNRMVGGSGHKKVVPFLKKFLIEKLKVSPKNLDVVSFVPDVEKAKKMYREDFEREIKGSFEPKSETYKKWDYFTKSMLKELDTRSKVKGHNLIWTRLAKEKTQKTLIIGAHFDTIAHDEKFNVKTEGFMPGADDNGSGVAVALSLIKLLKDKDLKFNVKVVFFDWEEFGFLGSHAFVKTLKKDDVIGYVNLEMLGNDTKSQDKLKRYQNMKVYIRSESDSKGYKEDKELLEQLTGPLKGNSVGVDFSVVSNSFNSSDHLSFWQEGIAAVTFTQDWENDFNKTRYHTSNDLPETLNMKTLYKSYQYIALSILNLVEI